MRTPKLMFNEQTGESYYRVRYRKDGKQRALTFYGADAEEEANAFIGLLDQLGSERAVAWWNAHIDEPPVGITVDEWWGRYLPAATGLTAGTRLTYDRTYRRVWSPRIGGKPLAAVSREDIALAVNEMSEGSPAAEPKADKTVKNHYGVIASMFKSAVAEGLIPVTPCTKIRMPRRTEHTAIEHRYLTNAEWEKLVAELRELSSAAYVALFTTLVGTGIRWGEAEALTVGDVLLDNYIEMPDGTLEPAPMLRINKAAKWNASKSTRQVGPTKTRKSNRTVTLPPEVVDVLEPLVAPNGVPRKSGERLFLAPKGGPLRHRTVYDTWKIAVQRAGLEPQPRIHDLRHTHVAWLIAQGMPIPVIQHRLGHESGATTNDVYGHLVPDLQISAARAASLAMKPRTVPKEIEP